MFKAIYEICRRFLQRPLVQGLGALVALLFGGYVLRTFPSVAAQVRIPTNFDEAIVTAALLFPFIGAAMRLCKAIVTLSRPKVLGPMLGLTVGLLLAAIAPGVLVLAAKLSNPFLLWLGMVMSAFTVQGILMYFRIGFEDAGPDPVSVEPAPAAPDNLFSLADERERLALQAKRRAEERARPPQPVDYEKIKREREERREQEFIARLSPRQRWMHQM
ncbi:MAG: hypothetical protein LCH80_01295 [Proteobacteria bacterium]|nr:hypothetical protein [Pseudomonadota bacterium]